MLITLRKGRNDMPVKKKARIILAKFGLDGHDNGIKTITKWLRDAGFEVVYMGLYNTAEGIIKAAQEEDVSIVGASFMEGEHMYYVPQLLELAQKKRMKIKFAIGGVIPPEDVIKLKAMGADAIFTPGTSRETVVEGVKALV
jgi:methylmalonyl-CoA mutase C-terminal domain/subunit